MRLLVSGRQMGKTERMIGWMMDNPDAICMVHTSMEADRLAETYNIDRKRFFTPGAVLFGQFPNHQTKLGVDNLDLILGRLLRWNGEIDLVTATGSIYPLDWDYETKG